MNLKTYLEHQKDYAGNLLWPLAIWQRQPIFKQMAVETAQSCAKGWVLDIGTGPGYLPTEIAKSCKNINVIGLDISSSFLIESTKRLEGKDYKSRINLIKSYAENLPFADNTFDSVQSMFSFHLWQDQNKGIREIYRVLKPDNQATILVGVVYLLHGIWRYIPFVTKRPYLELKNMCLAAGFKEVEVTKYKGVHDCVRVCMTK